MVNNASGLFVVGHQNELPLDGVHVAVRIVNLIAEVQVIQFYVNNTGGPIDCRYEFPLDENAAVCGFEVELENRLLIGEVKKKEVARVEYNAAMARGETAALLEQNKPDVFVQRIGNIPANSRVNIRVVYVADLAVDKDTGAAHFVLPTSVAPRYSPCPTALPWFRSWRECCFGRRLPPTHEERHAWDGRVEHLPWIPYAYYIPEAVINRERPGSFSVTIEAEMASRVVKMESQTHLIRTEKVSDLPQDACKMVASFWNDVEPMGKDLVVSITQEQPFEPSCQLEVAADGSGCAMLTLVPAFELEPKPVEIIFLVDCSGSMAGERIAASKRALNVFLHSLPLSCHFNIRCFGSSYHSIKRSSGEYSQESLEFGKRYIARIDANLGGTEILKPLQKIFSQPPVAARQLFILTDGQVSNTEEVIDLCRKNAVNTRVFTVGVGDEVSRHLVQGMARAGNGTAEFIVGKDLQGGGEGKGALEVKLINQLKLATLPSITKIDVDWLGGVDPVSTTPSIRRTANEPSEAGFGAASKPISKFFPMGPAQTSAGNGSASNVSTSQHSVGSGISSLNALARSVALNTQPKGRNEGLMQAPFLPPPLYSGSKFVMYCFFTKEQLDRFTDVHLTAEVPGGIPMAVSIPVRRVGSTGRSVQLLAARALIRDLSEDTSHLHWRKAEPTGRSDFDRFSSWSALVNSGMAQDRGSAWGIMPMTAIDAEVKKEMIDIGIKFGIVSKETSFIAVERFRDGSVTQQKAISKPFEQAPSVLSSPLGWITPTVAPAQATQRSRSAILGMAPSAPTPNSEGFVFTGGHSTASGYSTGVSTSTSSFGGGGNSSAPLSGGFGGSFSTPSFAFGSAPGAPPPASVAANGFGAPAPGRASTQGAFFEGGGNSSAPVSGSFGARASNQGAFFESKTSLYSSSTAAGFVAGAPSLFGSSGSSSASAGLASWPSANAGFGFGVPNSSNSARFGGMQASSAFMGDLASVNNVAGRATQNGINTDDMDDCAMWESDNDDACCDECDEDPSALTPTFSDRSMGHLLAMQKFDGSFDLSAGLAAQLGQSVDKIEFVGRTTLVKLLSGYITDYKAMMRIWTAVLFLKVLEDEYPRLKQAWELSAEKTRSWLSNTLSVAGVKDTKSMVAQVIAAAN